MARVSCHSHAVSRGCTDGRPIAVSKQGIRGDQVLRRSRMCISRREGGKEVRMQMPRADAGT